MSKISCDWNTASIWNRARLQWTRSNWSSLQSLYSNYTQFDYYNQLLNLNWAGISVNVTFFSWLLQLLFFFFEEQTSKNLKTCTFARPFTQRRHTLFNLCSHEHLSSHSHRAKSHLLCSTLSGVSTELQPTENLQRFLETLLIMIHDSNISILASRHFTDASAGAAIIHNVPPTQHLFLVVGLTDGACL